MSYLILLVDDNLDFLNNTKLLLEKEGYRVETSINGKRALEKLSSLNKPPDLILSDILMPEVDGYELLKQISKNPILNEIPFIFLTALSSDKEIRLGKMLGVDDYLTKPFNEKELFASIKGKLLRKERTKEAFNYVKEALNRELLINKTQNTEIKKEDIWIMLVIWDDIIGPKLISSYPEDGNLREIQELGNQCFYAIKVIYGSQRKIETQENLLFSLENVNRKAYIYFDAFSNPKNRSGETKFMLGVIAPTISYLNTLQIKKYFIELSKKIKNKVNWNIREYWNEISEIITSYN